jgi:hypothetical protein
MTDINQLVCESMMIGNIYEDKYLAEITAELILYYIHCQNGYIKNFPEKDILKSFSLCGYIRFRDMDDEPRIISGRYKIISQWRWEFETLLRDIRYKRRRYFLSFLIGYGLFISSLKDIKLNNNNEKVFNFKSNEINLKHKLKPAIYMYNSNYCNGDESSVICNIVSTNQFEMTKNKTIMNSPNKTNQQNQSQQIDNINNNNKKLNNNSLHQISNSNSNREIESNCEEKRKISVKQQLLISQVFSCQYLCAGIASYL